MRKYWITAADHASRVIFNKVVEMETLILAGEYAASVIPAEYHENICITDENNNPVSE